MEEHSENAKTEEQNGKSCTLFVRRVSVQRGSANLHVRRGIPRYRNSPARKVSQTTAAASFSLPPSLSCFNFLRLLRSFFLSFFKPGLFVMAARLAVVLERRQSSEVLLSLLELLSTFPRFIIVVRRRGAFHKRSSPPPPLARVITPRRRVARRAARRGAPCDALKEIKRGAFIRDEEKVNWRIRFIVISSAIKTAPLPCSPPVTLTPTGIYFHSVREKERGEARFVQRFFSMWFIAEAISSFVRYTALCRV